MLTEQSCVAQLSKILNNDNLDQILFEIESDLQIRFRIHDPIESCSDHSEDFDLVGSAQFPHRAARTWVLAKLRKKLSTLLTNAILEKSEV